MTSGYTKDLDKLVNNAIFHEDCDNMIVIKDDYGNDYEVSDLKVFKEHIKFYHSKNGKGDGSIHEENGFWFKVTEEFYDSVMNL